MSPSIEVFRPFMSPQYRGLCVSRKDGRGINQKVPATPSISEYNRHMGGVDTNDSFTAIDKSRKQYKWYGPLFIKSIMWALYNGFIIEGYFVNHVSQGSRKQDFRSFCLDVAYQLVDRFSSRQRIGRPSISRSSHRRIIKQNGKRTKTAFICSSAQCNVPLCIKVDSTCWRDWHTIVEFWR